MRDHGSIGLFGNSFFVGKFGSNCFGLFLFCFCLVWGEKGFWLEIKVRGPLHVVVSFLILFACDNSVLFKYCLVFRPFYIILSFSFDLWLGIFFSFAFFRCLTRNFLFLLFSSNLWSRNFFFLLFSSDLWSGTFFFFYCFWSAWATQQWVTLLSWETPLFLLPRARMKILILGQGLWWVGILAQGL